MKLKIIIEIDFADECSKINEELPGEFRAQQTTISHQLIKWRRYRHR